MLISVLLLEAVTLLVVLVLLLRKPLAPPPDARHAQLTETLIRHEARLEGIDHTLRAGLGALDSALRADLAMHRTESAGHALAARDAHDATSKHLREEIARSIEHLAGSLAGGLNTFRTDIREAGGALQKAVAQDLQHIGQRLSSFIAESTRAQMDAREALHTRLTSLHAANTDHQERLRTTVGDSLARLSADNAAKLEEMRQTVDEKLHATLHTRLTESFGLVTDQLNKVHSGLGEMSKLSEGVEGLSRIFTNVKSRGGFAEVQLGMLLKQMLAPGQYIENAIVKPGTSERVEYAIRFPSHAGERLMPVDAKFPREAWERLEAAYDANIPEAILREGRSFESAIRAEAGRICSKYINAPVTTPYAIMFLPTEGLYAEVIRREALQAEIQSKCHVTIAGPTTLSAILTSFQMGFHLLALQEKGDEVWKVLEAAKTEFSKFGKLMEKVEGDVGKIQKTLGEVGVRTRAINRALRDVSSTSEESAVIPFEDFANTVHQLAAQSDEP